jgi:hypothetical protein
MKRFVIGGPPSNHRDDIFANLITYLNQLPEETKHVVEIKRHVKKRSLDQNAYIHAVPLKMMSDKTGYSVDDIKTFMCGEFSGWRETEIFGRKRAKPMLSTSDMDSKQMSDFIEFLIWFGADKMGISIPYPNED